jgi:hypothetical protein
VICPLDGSPCTGDHSGRCYSQCEEEKRRIPRVPVKDYVKAEVVQRECSHCGHIHTCREDT